MGFSFEKFSTFLAPMRDLTDSPFMKIIAERGCPDFFCAEYFRIHEYYDFEPRVLDAILSRPLGRPVVAQLIGEDARHIARAVRELKKTGCTEMLDFNLGCPVPKICRKNVGGGLLRFPEKIGEILRTIRGEWDGIFSVKMRLGFNSEDEFKVLFEKVASESPDWITVHARTVKQLYRGRPNFVPVKWAAENFGVPVVANGDIDCARAALETARYTGCSAVMVGRGAVRNPWVFRQIGEAFSNAGGLSGVRSAGDSKIRELCGRVFVPTLGDVREYVEKLRISIESEGAYHADSRLKKFLNFVGLSIDPEGEFLRRMRRGKGMSELMKICDEFMLAESGRPFPQEAYSDLCARPNHEG